MRTGNGKTPTFSPDDGDKEGFQALLTLWVEQYRIPVRERDIWLFANHWADCSMVGLRSPKQWVDKLLAWIGQQ